MAVRSRLAGLAPWSGLIAAAFGWALHHQVVSEALHFDCNATSDGAGIAWGVFALVLVVAGALVSWRARPGKGNRTEAAAMHRFIVDLSLMAATLAMLAISFQILAGVLLPGCRP